MRHRQQHRFHFFLLPLAITIFFTAQVVIAQRTGGAAQGGSVRPDKVFTADEYKSPLVIQGASSKEECDPNTVNGTCPGTFSFAYGFNANARPRSGGSSSIRAGFAFATYVTKRIFLEVDNDNVISAKPVDSARITGIGDTNLYAGADILLGTKKYEPALTVLYGLKAPSASVAKGLGTGKVDHTIMAALSKVIGKSNLTYLELDVGNSFAGRQESSGFDSFPFASAILRQKLDAKKRFTLHVEFGGNFRTSNYIGDAYNLDYLETQLTPFFAIRTGGRFGITDNLTRAGLYLGVKFTGNLKKAF